MARFARNAAELEKELEKFSGHDIVSIVCHLFSQGVPVARISDHIRKEFPTLKINREDPYLILSQEAKRGRFRYESKLDFNLAERIVRKTGLKRVVVVNTEFADEVAIHGAAMVLEILDDIRQKQESKNLGMALPNETVKNTEVVRVGVGGGETLRLLAHRLSHDVLRDRTHLVPQKIAFHSLVGTSREVKMEGSKPYLSALSHFGMKPLAGVETIMVSLPFPDIVSVEEYRVLDQLTSLKELKEFREKFDLILTAASDFSDPHASLRILKERWKKNHLGSVTEQNENPHLVGDFLWIPLDRFGNEIPLGGNLHTVAIFNEVAQIQKRIENGGNVMLVVAPCVECRKPRNEIVSAIFSRRTLPVTHLVIDNRSVEGLLRVLWPPKPWEYEKS